MLNLLLLVCKNKHETAINPFEKTNMQRQSCCANVYYLQSGTDQADKNKLRSIKELVFTVPIEN